jgi:methylenetetrahydrofolate dehydrogenase (NADP+)/methenyltetrahydrofolate cyclohydrolase
MLVERHATVTIAHSRTEDLAAEGARADILVAAAGVPGLLGRSAIKAGAVVIDVGTTWIDGPGGGRMAGDVDAAAADDIASARTPVPGGVGPVTTAILLRTAIELAEARLERATN